MPFNVYVVGNEKIDRKKIARFIYNAATDKTLPETATISHYEGLKIADQEVTFFDAAEANLEQIDATMSEHKPDIVILVIALPENEQGNAVEYANAFRTKLLQKKLTPEIILFKTNLNNYSIFVAPNEQDSRELKATKIGIQRQIGCVFSLPNYKMQFDKSTKKSDLAEFYLRALSKCVMLKAQSQNPVQTQTEEPFKFQPQPAGEKTAPQAIPAKASSATPLASTRVAPAPIRTSTPPSPPVRSKPESYTPRNNGKFFAETPRTPRTPDTPTKPVLRRSPTPAQGEEGQEAKPGSPERTISPIGTNG
jgi:hypothetical protein